jgi:hypothetical protein
LERTGFRLWLCPALSRVEGIPGQVTVQEAGGRDHREYWIPAEDLSAFNAALIGKIEVVAEYP